MRDGAFTFRTPGSEGDHEERSRNRRSLNFTPACERGAAFSITSLEQARALPNGSLINRLASRLTRWKVARALPQGLNRRQDFALANRSQPWPPIAVCALLAVMSKSKRPSG